MFMSLVNQERMSSHFSLTILGSLSHRIFTVHSNTLNLEKTSIVVKEPEAIYNYEYTNLSGVLFLNNIQQNSDHISETVNKT